MFPGYHPHQGVVIMYQRGYARQGARGAARRGRGVAGAVPTAMAIAGVQAAGS
jgi:hypothetical protein